MSSTSVTSSKRGRESADLQQELESVRALNKTLNSYLEHIILFKKNLSNVNKNCQQLQKINTEWIDSLESLMNRQRK